MTFTLLFYDPHLNPSKGFYTQGFDSTIGAAPIVAYLFLGFFVYIAVRVWWEYRKHKPHDFDIPHQFQHGQKID